MDETLHFDSSEGCIYTLIAIVFSSAYSDDMGLGKTVQCIALLWSVIMHNVTCHSLQWCRTLLKQGAYGGKPVMKRALVVTPGSLVKASCDDAVCV